MRNYQATAAQARYVNVLADQVGMNIYEEAFERACRINGNRGYGNTITQQVRRLSKKAASQLISDLIAAKEAQTRTTTCDTLD